MTNYHKGQLIQTLDGTYYQVTESTKYLVFANPIQNGKAIHRNICIDKNIIKRIRVHILSISEKNINRIMSNAGYLNSKCHKSFLDLANNYNKGEIILFICNIKKKMCFCTANEVTRKSHMVDMIPYVTPGHREFFICIDGINLIG